MTLKYLNSPETPIFHKSKLLYNFHQARPFIRKRGQVVLFEGYADVLAAVKVVWKKLLRQWEQL